METRARNHRELPLHISDEGGRYVVRVRRGAVTFRARVPKTRPDALAEAVRLKERFERRAGPALYPRTKPLNTAAQSNTGIIGITETTKWNRGRPRDCFHVALFGRPTCKRIYYGSFRPRAVALAIAVQLRQQTEAAHG